MDGGKMSVMIKGMEMPKTCDDCYIRERNTCPLLKTNVGGWGRCIGCPLVEVQPHGRLIDADAFLALINDCTILSNVHKWFINSLISGEPTVIEAEE